MFAPQTVFEKYNAMIDYLYDCCEKKSSYSFASLRELALQFLSDVRKDIGLYSDKVAYKGTR